MLSNVESHANYAMNQLVSEAMDSFLEYGSAEALTKRRAKGTLPLPVGFSGWKKPMTLQQVLAGARLPHGPNRGLVYRVDLPRKKNPLYIGSAADGKVLARMKAHVNPPSNPKNDRGSKKLRAALQGLDPAQVQVRVGWATDQPPDSPARTPINNYELFLLEKLLQLTEHPKTWRPSDRPFDEYEAAARRLGGLLY
jgi:hypothetical protein